MNEYFLRKISLVIYVGGQLYATYNSDGTRGTIGISFSVTKTLVGTPNQSTVTLTNLSPETKATILACTNRENPYVELFVGYEENGLTLLACGDLIKMWPERNGSSDTFTLTFLDGYAAIVNGSAQAQYPPGMDINDVVLNVAQTLAIGDSIQIDETKVVLIGHVGDRGLTVSGRTASVLDQLAKEYGFTWSIQDGVFQAYDDALSLSQDMMKCQRIFDVSFDFNLFKATPELGEKYMQQIGMKIEALLEPKCRCGDLINLNSSVYPQYNGAYLIENITFTGDAFGADWKMEIDSKMKQSLSAGTLELPTEE